MEQKKHLSTNEKLVAWRGRLIDLLRAAAEDDVFLSMSTVDWGQPDTNPYDKLAALAMADGGTVQYKYDTVSHLEVEPVQISDRVVIADVYVTATEAAKYELKENGHDHKERVPLDRDYLHSPPANTVYVHHVGRGAGAAYLTHQIAQFLAWRGLEDVSLFATHNIDAVETMMKPGSGPFTHPRKDSATWIGKDIPVCVVLDETQRTRDLRENQEIVVTETLPEFIKAALPDLPISFGIQEPAYSANMHFGDMSWNPDRAQPLPVQHTDGRPYTGKVKPKGGNGHFGPVEVVINTMPEEPFFVLLGRDPQAAVLVEQWASERQQIEPNDPKVANALNIASYMREYKDANPSPGMAKLVYEEYLKGELIIIPQRESAYSEEEICSMAMAITEVAVLSGVELNVKNNTVFVHSAVGHAVEQQLAHASKIAQAGGVDALVIVFEEDQPVMAWGRQDLLYNIFDKDTADSVVYYRPGEHEDTDANEPFEVPNAPRLQ